MAPCTRGSQHQRYSVHDEAALGILERAEASPAEIAEIRLWWAQNDR